MAGEKTEKATPKRKQDERKKGNIFMSQDIVTVASLFASFYAIKFLAPRLLHTMEQSICDSFFRSRLHCFFTDGVSTAFSDQRLGNFCDDASDKNAVFGKSIRV